MEWLDRTLVRSPYRIGLCLNEKDYKKELKRLNVPKIDRVGFVPFGFTAAVHSFEKEGILMVCLSSENKLKKIDIHCLLVHEAVHIWQRTKYALAEHTPSCEFEAYAIQNISRSLIDSYNKQIKQKKKKAT